MDLGKYIQQSITIAGGGDEWIAHTVLTAPPTHDCWISAINAYGGDSGEGITFWQIPTNAIAPNTEPKAGDVSGSLQLSSTAAFMLETALGQTDVNARQTAYAADDGRGPVMGTFPLIVIPAGYSLIVASHTANTNAIQVAAGGFLVAV